MKPTKLYHWFTNLDLLIVSVWSLFAMRYAFVGFESIVLWVIVRIALSFEMRRCSPWTIYSAVMFAVMAFGIFDGYAFNQTFQRMMFHALWLCLGTKEAMAAFHPLDSDIQIWIYCLKAFWYLWFAVVPIIVGILLKNFKTIDFKHKGLLIYIVVCFIAWSPIGFFDYDASMNFMYLFMVLLPAVYWAMYQRGRRSLVEIVLANKGVSSYIGVWLGKGARD